MGYMGLATLSSLLPAFFREGKEMVMLLGPMI